MAVSKQQTDNRFTAILDGMRYHQKTKMEVDIKVYDNVNGNVLDSNLLAFATVCRNRRKIDH